MDPAQIKIGLEVVAAVFSALKPAPSTTVPRKLQCDYSRHETAVGEHMRAVESWSATVQARDAYRPLHEIVVQLEVYAGDERRKPTNRKTASAKSLLRKGHSCVLLGGPGAGKTTTLKQIATHILHEEPNEREDIFAYPIVVRVRDMARGEDLTGHILNLLGIRLEFSPPIQSVAAGPESEAELQRLRFYLATVQQQVLCELLRKVKPLVLVDGLDEAHVSDMRQLSIELEQLISKCGEAAFVISCRHGAYVTVIAGCTAYTLQSFTDEQITEFVQRWFGDPVVAAEFMACIRLKPYRDLAAIPLHATNFCMIYASYGDLPHEHTRVYEKIVDIRVREWDWDRGVVRKSAIAASFGPEEKRRFLAATSFELAKLDQGASFNVHRFDAAFGALRGRFKMESVSAREVLNEIEAHTGLIYLSSFERYDFIHKTIQEFLCGEYLSRVPIVSEYQYFLRNMPDACAIATILSNEPDCMVLCIWSGLFSSASPLNSADWVVFWAQYFARLAAERAGFAGNKILGLGLVNVVSQCYHGRAATKGDFQQRLIQSLTEVVKLTGVPEGLNACLQHARIIDKAPPKWGADWVKMEFSRVIGVSDSFGRYTYPDQVVIPKFLLSA